MGTVRIKLTGYGVHIGGADPTTEDLQKVAEVKMWYDRHLRLWEIWAVDAEGNQIGESRYAPRKQEAMEVKKDFENEIG